MKFFLKFAAILSLVFSSAVIAEEFVGEIVLKPTGCEKGLKCTLGEDFGYIDRWNVGWLADAGEVTDGASIPRWAQRFVGVPFTPAFLPAAVLHDHYSKSERPVNGWLQTQRMFYEALRHNGVEDSLALTLFGGVLAGSGKWITKMEGITCDLGETCVQQTVLVSLEREPASFGSSDYLQLMERIQLEVENGNVSSADAVLELLKQERPDDIYLRNPSGVIKKNIKVSIPTFDR